MAIPQFTGVKVFSTTLARDREVMGEKITTWLKENPNVEIIDILTDPERGLQDGIIVTPMLIRIEPAPERRVLGSLHDRLQLLAVLGLNGAPHE